MKGNKNQYQPGVRRGAVALGLCWLLAAQAALAGAPEMTSVFVQPAAPLAAGGEGRIWLYGMNNSAGEASYTFEPRIDCKLTWEHGATKGVLVLNTNSGAAMAKLAPGSFAKREYRFEVPDVVGRVKLDIRNYNTLEIAVQRDALARPAEKVPASAAGPAAKAPVKKNQEHSEVTQFLTEHLSTYEPIYFILGSYPAAEFQFSLKARVFTFKDESNFLKNGLDHLYFGFTQTSFWDLISKDPSFYDTSYKPSAFLYYTNVLRNTNADGFHLDLQGGGEHESNGRGGAEERSIYTGYLQPTASYELPENLTLSVQPRARFYYLVGHNNPDIADYRGYADLLASLTWQEPASGEKIQFATKLQLGDTGKHAGLKFDLRFNLAGVPWLSAFNPTIQLQYFTGYGQTFRQYNQASQSYRAGLCLWFF